jgi:hypothetical protein
MSLLGGVGCGVDAADGFAAILAPGPREHKGWWCERLRIGSGCGEKEIQSAVADAGTCVTAVEP